MRAVPVLACWLLLTTATTAGTDSLLRVLHGLPADTSRLPVLLNLLRGTVFNEPDKALEFAAEYRRIATLSGIPIHLGEGHNFTGMCHSARGEYDRALDHYLAALPHFEKSGDQWYTAMAHNNIGSVHAKLGDKIKARTEYTLALNGFATIPDTVWTANVGNNLANLYYNDHQYDSAVVYYSRAERMLTGTGMGVYLGSTRMNLANALEKTLRNEEALAMMRSALQAMTIGADENSRANLLLNLGRLHDTAGDPDSALIYIRQGHALAQQVQALPVEANAHEFLAHVFERRGALDSALVHHKRWAILNDSIYNAERTAQIAEMQEKYESGKKDVQLAEHRAQLEQRSLTIKAVVAGAILLLIATLFAFRAYRVKRRSEAELAQKNTLIGEQLKEKELLVREIHHRVKNNLQTVSSLLSIQGRGITDEKAREAVNDGRLRVKSMALIHQDLYRDGDLTGVRMPEYVDKLVNSLLASYAADGRITADIRVEEIALDVDTAIPIGLVLNELVTNALKYAWPGERTGRLQVQLQRTADTLHLSVADDGVGRTDTQGDERSSGFGLDMVRTFAGKLKAEWTMDQTQGTVVKMQMRSFKLAR